VQTDALELWQAQYGSFYEGLSLVAVEVIYWPIYRHILTANLRQTTVLDALEEGLLRIVEAGISSVDELATLLGCSRAYVETMGQYLKAGVTPYVNVSGETWSPTPATIGAITAGERTILVSEDRDVLRDGLFGYWLSHGDAQFKVTETPSSEKSPSRWLGPLVKPDVEEQEFGDICRLAVSTFGADVGVHSYDAQSSGELEWVALHLLNFQSTDQKVGRVLLLNPESEDRPLDDLSFRFEQQLRTDDIPLYFPDNSLKTGLSFWESLATSVVGFSAREAVASIESDLDKTILNLKTLITKHDTFEKLPDFSKKFADAMRIAQQTNSGEALLAVFDALTELLHGLSFRASLPPENCSHLDCLRRLRANSIISTDQCDRLEDIARQVELSISSSFTSDSDKKHTSERLVALLKMMSSELGLVPDGSLSQEREKKEVIYKIEVAIAKRDAERPQIAVNAAKPTEVAVGYNTELPTINPDVDQLCRKAFTMIKNEPLYALVLCRMATEQLANFLLDQVLANRRPGPGITLAEKIRFLGYSSQVSAATASNMHTCRLLGNDTLHPEEGDSVSKENAKVSWNALAASVKAIANGLPRNKPQYENVGTN